MTYEITIADPDGDLEATFVPEVGMIGSSLRHDGEELLYQGSGLQAYADHGSTFALPLLHPWANRLRSWDFELEGRRVLLDPDSPITHRDAATGTPIHGLLTASPYWQVRRPSVQCWSLSSTSAPFRSTSRPSRSRTGCGTCIDQRRDADGRVRGDRDWRCRRAGVVRIPSVSDFARLDPP